MDPELTLPLDQAYQLMLERHGHQGWWPADTDFEMCVGAILTQNTSWTQVEKALSKLKQHNCLTPHALHEVEPETLAEWIRPAGYFRLKTQRLKAFVGVLVDEYEGEVSCLMAGERSQVRLRLLNIHGIGPETADSMMLYAGGHAIFVVDAYTRRIFSRHGWCHPQAPYHTLQEICQNGIQAWQSSSESRVEGWKDYHAQLVQIGKDFCRPRNPKCDLCPLQSLL